MLARAPPSASVRPPSPTRSPACPRSFSVATRRVVTASETARVGAKLEASNLRGNAAVAASAVTSTASSPSTPTASSFSSTTFDLACPICHVTRFSVSHAGGRNSLLSAPRPNCPSCGRTFDADADFLDLTPSSGVTTNALSSEGASSSPSSFSASSSSSSSSLPNDVEKYWSGTQIFRSPLVAAAYDNGWRAGFSWAGFPGADDEFDAAMARIAPVATGKVLLDLSCGSGLFARRFVKSGAFSGVVAADYSEAMLRTAAAGLRSDGADPARYLPLRLDAARLPFANASLPAVHAGAAIHCWPAPALAVAEVARVLEPGGVFVASTFLDAASPLEGVVGEKAAGAFRNLLARPLEAAASRSAYRWWTEAELRGMCSSAGLVDFRRWRSNRFILFSAKKRG